MCIINKFLVKVDSNSNWRMVSYGLNLLVCFTLFGTLADGQLKLPPYPPDVNYTPTFPQLVANNGYKAETHTVTTEDGYILTLFRIPRGRKCRGPIRQPPVLIMHGFLESADCFIDGDPNAVLGYLIPDECYDTWFGSYRGTFYSRAHVKLNPDTDRKFWQFSTDEMGMYDVPAFIDYVLYKTGSEQLNYMGFSQGGGTFFIMCSERPGYCNKAKLFIGLAPATRHLNTRSLPFRLITQAINGILEHLEEAGIYEMLTKGYPIQRILNFLCQNDIFAGIICGILDAILDGPNPGSITANTLRIVYEHTPAGISTKLAARYGQAMTETEFLMFDYGPIANTQLYGRTTPPAYNLSAVTCPVVVIQGRNDGIVDMRDSLWAAKQMPNLLEYHNVTDPLWTHFDNIRSQYIPKYTFPTVRKYLKEYSSAGVGSSDDESSRIPTGDFHWLK
ncbi:gastric triacylglycerol lipase-like isoform X3 [Cydia fagiglandana]|uniref:gastric triacylglycerol lipase-like isoform X3 n=2 Tax=Cydia fagiglandana TaxID=1458189 RepID=UPI002FEE1874